MVTSATYRQSSQGTDREIARDPGNELLGRMNRRRLAVEQWRDGMLAVSGELACGDGHSMELDNPTNFHRTVYARISRLQLDSLLMQFDYPDANVHAEKRNVTTTAIQKLFEMNSTFVQDRARALATKLQSAGADDASRVRVAYRLLFARDPDRDELELALAFLKKPSRAGLNRWEQYAQSLLISNEMLYVD
jgi:hypothetical protein